MSSNPPPALNVLKPLPGYSLPDFTNLSIKNAPQQQDDCDDLSVISEDEISSDAASEDEVSNVEAADDETSKPGAPDDNDDLAAGISDPEWKRHGMTASREPNERYTGGAKDSLFAERYGRVPWGQAGGGDEDEDDGEQGPGNGGGGGDRGGGPPHAPAMPNGNPSGSLRQISAGRLRAARSDLDLGVLRNQWRDFNSGR